MISKWYEVEISHVYCRYVKYLNKKSIYMQYCLEAVHQVKWRLCQFYLFIHSTLEDEQLLDHSYLETCKGS